MKTKLTSERSVDDRKHNAERISNENSFSLQFLLAKEYSWYSIGLIIRIFGTLIYPQRGYIHPDEFFQGPEIVFDDMFQTNLTRTHEFNSTTPLRSVGILYLLYGLPVSFLYYLSSIYHWSSVPFHFKLILPRFTILFLSLCADIVFFRLIKLFYPNMNVKEYGIMMNYYGIAHVTLVFFTRTLSNSFESFLFVSLIYFIHLNISLILSISSTSSSANIYFNARFIKTSFFIGFICALGIFNRPTFPAFAIVPLLYWFKNVFPIIGRSHHYHFLLGRVISVIVGTFISISCLIILFDTCYYNKNNLEFLTDFKSHIIICPLNFILYNMDSKNLNEHGLHPPWLHFIVNATILYGPLHLYFILWNLFHISTIKQYGQIVIDQIVKVFRKKEIIIQRSECSASNLVYYLYLVPFIPLSTFLHQEPRFLLPLLFPLILSTVPNLIQAKLHRFIFRLWLGFNIFLAILYGHLHQGGLLPALKHIHDNQIASMDHTSANININQSIIVTYHTYMPPGYLVTYMSKSKNKQTLETIIIDLKGAEREQFDLTIKNIFIDYSMNSVQVFVILPVKCRNDLIHSVNEKYKFSLVKQFSPHLDLDHGFDELSHNQHNQTLYQWIQAAWNVNKLDLYQVTYR